MAFAAVIPATDLLAANAALEAAGYGPMNFAIPAYGAVAPTHAALHSWDEGAFLAAVQAVPGATVAQGDGDPQARVKALIEAQGARWPLFAPPLPSAGTVAVGDLYTSGGSTWRVIQTFNRSTFGADPETYPALIRRVRTPGAAEPWVQPLDQFDAYKLVNPFTGQPDRCTFGGQTWRVSQADGSGNNVWQPGVFGWVAL